MSCTKSQAVTCRQRRFLSTRSILARVIPDVAGRRALKVNRADLQTKSKTITGCSELTHQWGWGGGGSAWRARLPSASASGYTVSQSVRQPVQTPPLRRHNVVKHYCNLSISQSTMQSESAHRRCDLGREGELLVGALHALKGLGLVQRVGVQVKLERQPHMTEPLQPIQRLGRHTGLHIQRKLEDQWTGEQMMLRWNLSSPSDE